MLHRSLLFISCLFIANWSQCFAQTEPVDTLQLPQVLTIDTIDAIDTIAPNPTPVSTPCDPDLTRYDKIYRTNGDILVVEVIEVLHSIVVFKYPLNTARNSLRKAEILKLVYASGSESSFTDNEPTAINQPKRKDVESKNVRIQYDQAGLENLEKLDFVSASLKGRSNANADHIEKGVLVLLRNKAAKMGATVIVIIDKQVTHDNDGNLKVFIKAVAYNENQKPEEK